MATRGRGRRSSGSDGGRGVGERRSIVQAMRARGRGRGGRGRSPSFELAGGLPGGAGTVVASAASLQQLFRQARASGSLNLTSRGLEQVPDQVFNLIG
ncbi:unnamed protein product, partial [Sphacelaria rigidula]